MHSHKQKDEKNNYFTCDNLKIAVAPGSETIVSFKFTPPQKDEFIVKDRSRHFSQCSPRLAFSAWLAQLGHGEGRSSVLTGG